ncbi:T9SS type A sorting domain-containing protein [Flavobacterium sp.]|uniref:RCC1 domain-containing protein n=1 Tax=Flavobacterium sp. TaxID=239 RepID=UPI0039E4B9E9
MKAIITAALFAVSGYLSAQCFQKITAGEQHFIAISQDGTLWGWGENGQRQIGDGTTTDRPMPVSISTDSWKYASAGATHTVAIKADGTLWAWGSDSHEKLGNGSGGNAASPVQIGSANDWKEVAAGERGTLAIKANGTLWAWGTNDNGYLGNGANVNYVSNVPVQIGTDSDWNHISGNGRHCLALKTNGTLWGWGWNNNGQIGIGTIIDSNIPVQIGTVSDWRHVDAGTRLSFALKTNNTLWAWGNTTTGLGINSSIPQQVGTDENWLNIAVKRYEASSFAMLTKTDGTLWAWGNDAYQQLGNGNSNGDYSVPTQIGDETDWVDSFAGFQQGGAVKQDGTFWAWGDTALVGDSGIPSVSAIQYACTPLKVESNNIISVILYPNPATARLNISGVDVKAAAAYDIGGRQFPLIPQGNALDISALAAGLYMLRIETGSESFSESFIKE